MTWNVERGKIKKFAKRNFCKLYDSKHGTELHKHLESKCAELRLSSEDYLL